MKKKKVLIAAGGTGGHLFPAQELAELIRDRADVVFAGHKLSQNKYFKRDQHRSFDVASAPFNKKLSFCLALGRGLYQSVALLLKEKPDVVVGFGSYHTVPLMLASVLLRKKIVLYEANRTLGKVTKLFAPAATHLASQFPLLGTRKSTLVPLFPWLPKKEADRIASREAYGLDPAIFTILVFGGSQGADFLNEVVPKAVELLNRPVQIIHFGLEESPYSVKSVVKTFETNMAKAYAAADFVIGRSGAGTVSELIRYQLPSLLIPYPFAYGHQEDNAKYVVDAGGAFMLLQKEVTPEKIVSCIQSADLLGMQACLKLIDPSNRTALEDLIL
jgi:UDP-N-acetylglucosamine--N-acetylmuramyl-(pentapeptide) pyrophosphoryl-undecaprenol N-acetylglucosamine transferase